MILNGVKSPDTRCQAITAALIRNYVDARVIPMNSLIENLDPGRAATVLVIPNLYLSAMTKQMPAWRVQVMYDLLLERSIRSKPTVAYVEDLDGLKGIYGAPFRDFLDRFLIVS
jgi:hypothetical protein